MFLVLWVNKHEEVLNVVLDKDYQNRQVLLYTYVCVQGLGFRSV
jgi:hypothetical protein